MEGTSQLHCLMATWKGNIMYQHDQQRDQLKYQICPSGLHFSAGRFLHNSSHLSQQTIGW
jgi:hypothetical protein